MIYSHLSWIKPIKLCLCKWPVLMSLDIKTTQGEIEIIFCSPCLLSSVMDYVYRIWIQLLGKMKESSSVMAQLTSYDSWWDTLRRAQHHLCDSTAKMCHLNLIMRTQTDKHMLKDLLQSRWSGLFKDSSMSWKTKRPSSTVRLMETKEAGQWNAMHASYSDSVIRGNNSY